METKDLQFVIKSFNDLNTHELYALLKLRAAVFVVEQNCAYLDMDDKDQNSFHVMMYYKDKLAAYARCLPAGISYDTPAVGRVVIDQAFRANKWAYVLMQHCNDFCKTQFGAKKITLSAQHHLQHFYEKCGYTAVGDIYLEDDIPHIKMILQ